MIKADKEEDITKLKVSSESLLNYIIDYSGIPMLYLYDVKNVEYDENFNYDFDTLRNDNQFKKYIDGLIKCELNIKNI